MRGNIVVEDNLWCAIGNRDRSFIGIGNREDRAFTFSSVMESTIEQA